VGFGVKRHLNQRGGVIDRIRSPIGHRVCCMSGFRPAPTLAQRVINVAKEKPGGSGSEKGAVGRDLGSPKHTYPLRAGYKRSKDTGVLDLPLPLVMVLRGL
jgi:hypothetical protein